MIIKALKTIGINSDLMYSLGFASVATSIAVWSGAKKSGDSAHAERWGMFIGLWAPTFMALGNGMDESEKKAELTK